MTLRSDRMHRGTSDDHPAGVDGCPICAGVGPARTVRLAPVLTVRVRAALAAALLGVASAGPPGALASVRPAEQSPAAAADATDPGPLDTESGPDPTDPQLDHDAPLVDPDETTDGSDADEQPAPAPATGDASPSPAEAPPTTPADTTPSNPAPSDAAPPAAPPSGASPPAATSPPAAPVAPPAPAAAPRTTAPGAGVALLPDLTPAPMPELAERRRPERDSDRHACIGPAVRRPAPGRGRRAPARVGRDRAVADHRSGRTPVHALRGRNAPAAATASTWSRRVSRCGRSPPARSAETPRPGNSLARSTGSGR